MLGSNCHNLLTARRRVNTQFLSLLSPKYPSPFICKNSLLSIVFTNSLDQAPPPEGGTPLYKLYRYVPPQRVWLLSRFGLKTGIDFDHYGLKSGMVFDGTTGAYKRICLFNAK